MAMMNFQEVTTRMQDVTKALDGVIEKAASLLYSGIQNKIDKGKVSSTMKADISNAIKEFPPDIREKILIHTIVLLAANNSSTASSGSGMSYGGGTRSRDGLFGRSGR